MKNAPEVFNTIFILCEVSVLVVLTLIFAHWRKGPTWWIGIAKYLFAVMLLTIYFAFPVTNFCLLFPILSKKALISATFRSYTVFFAVSSLSKPIEFYFLIYKTVIP